ncbi:MAG: hypothetical protein AB1629_02785 [Candidatus Omnitrophota bacterium]
MKNARLIILLVLIIIMVFVWSTSFKKIKRPRIMAKGSVALEPEKDVKSFVFWQDRMVKGRKVSAFKQWGRNPFALTQGMIAESSFRLLGILWDIKIPQAIINDTVVGVGDVIDGYNVVGIEKNKVILNNGTNTLELILWEEKDEGQK